MPENVPTYADVESAARRIAGQAVKTPLLQNTALDELSAANVFIKPECLQRTGSFKFRGAYNAIAGLPGEERAKGIVAASSGNHAQGIAEAAHIFGVGATIVMPSDAPEVKIQRTRRSGADIVFFDRASDDREAVTAKVVGETGGVLVHPFNNAMVIAGQGTVGLEIADDLVARSVVADRVLVCTGGGGLTAGVALAIRQRFTEAKIHPVEPEGFDDYRRSLISGNLESNNKTSGSICDAIITPVPGEIGFSINRDILSEGLVVSDQQALEAVRFAFDELKLVVEPGGAVALAALLAAGKKWAGEKIAIVLSGGNIDTEVMVKALNL